MYLIFDSYERVACYASTDIRIIMPCVFCESSCICCTKLSSVYIFDVYLILLELYLYKYELLSGSSHYNVF